MSWLLASLLAAGAPAVLVHDLQTAGLSLAPDVVAGLSDYVALRLAEQGRLRLVPRSALKLRLREVKRGTHGATYDRESQVELGRDLAARKMVTTRIVRMGTRCTVSMGLYDLERSATETAATVQGSCEDEGILASLDEAVARLTRSTSRQKARSPPPGMVLVPAGEFWMGCNRAADAECRRDERPGRTVHLDAFYIDRTEVTVEAYAACVRAGACDQPRPRKANKYRSTWQTPGRGRYPVNGVTWYQARGFCRWSRKRLPTEAEWEKAARGADGRKYPWGDSGAGCGFAIMDDGGDGCGRDSPGPVCSCARGLSPYGLCDMAGNVQEWVDDWYAKDQYRVARGRDPTGPVSGSKRVLRSSDYDSSKPRDLRTSHRGRADPEKVSSEVGFRCARSSTSPPGEGQEEQE